MKEFVFLFRMDITSKEAQPTPEQMQQYMQDWMAWINKISNTGQLANGGNHFLPTGKVLRPEDKITDEPYTVNKESVAGYLIIFAKDMKNAIRIAEKCPILKGVGTSVEVRETSTPPAMKEAK